MGLTFKESESSDFKKIQFNIDIKINEEGEDHTSQMTCLLFKTFPFSFTLNGSEVYGDFWIKKKRTLNQAGESAFVIGVTTYNLNPFYAEMDMLFIDVNNPDNKKEVKSELIKSNVNTNSVLRSKVNEDKSSKGEENYNSFHRFWSSMPLVGKTLKGNFKLMFATNPSKQKGKNGNFKSILCDEAISQLEEEKNFALICEGQTFYFCKALLSMISEVFGRMIATSNSKESSNNFVEIEDFTPDTIRAFQRVAFGDEEIKDEDLTPELLMFAQKYLMKPLVTKIKLKLMDSINNENIFGVIKAAYLIDDQEMFKEASKYLWKNMEQLKGTPEWNAFKIEHSVCMIEALTI